MEPETNLPKAKTTGTSKELKPGFASPIKAGDKLPDYVNPKTRMAKGFDAAGVMQTANLQALQSLHGKDAGLDLYISIAKAGGFYDPNMEPSGGAFYPDLQLEGMNKAAREAVDAILSEKE